MKIKPLNLGSGSPRQKAKSDYLYPYIFRFSCITNSGVFSRGETHIKPEDLPELSTYMEKALRSLIKDCHEEPTSKEKQRHGNRFQKVTFKSETYTVNYKLSLPGWMIWALSIDIENIKLAHREGSSVELIF